MKFAVVLCIFAAVAGFSHADPTEEQMEKATAAVEVCKPKTGATDDDMTALMNHEMPETKTGQCFVACMNKELKIMTADNKFDVAQIKELAASLKEKDAEKYEKGMKVIETCAAEANGGSDECDVAKIMMTCSKKEAAAEGIMMGSSR